MHVLHHSFRLAYPALIALLFYTLLTQVTLCFAATSQRTIDDTFGDSVTGELPIYSPADQFSPNSDCSSCKLHPDPSSAFSGTWHDSSQLPGGSAVSVTLSFTGTAISIFCILANGPASDIIQTSDFGFTLDGATQPSYTHDPDGTSDFAYNQTVFDASGLTNSPHTVVMVTNNPSGSLMLFDYASYTFDDGVETGGGGAAGSAGTDTTTTTTTNTDTLVSTTTTTSILPDSKVQTSISVESSSSQIVRTSGSPPASSIISNSPSSTASSLADHDSNLGNFTVTVSGSLTRLVSSPSASAGALTGANTSGKRINAAAIVAATLTPIVVLVLGGIFLCRRRHARYVRELDDAHVHSPDPDWVHVSNPSRNRTPFSDSPSSGDDLAAAHSAPDQDVILIGSTKMCEASGADVVEQNSSSPHQSLEYIGPATGYGDTSPQAQLLRAPTFRTLYHESPPPAYDSRRQPPLPGSEVPPPLPVVDRDA